MVFDYKHLVVVVAKKNRNIVRFFDFFWGVKC